MAFDEDFHLGIIKIYAHHISPFFVNQPEGANTFGAVARDPSYLYHYIFSFFYRFISLFTLRQSVIVIIFRILNILLFSIGLILTRKLLKRLGISSAIINFSTLCFILIPVVPLLAAQINYDNLLFPALVYILILSVDYIKSLQNKNYQLSKLILILSLCLITTIIKYAFLPIFLGIICTFLYLIIKNVGIKRFSLTSLRQFRGYSLFKKIILSLLLLFSIFLFSEQYVVNIIKYNNLVPNCNQILSNNDCSQYGPWIRDNTLKANKALIHDNIIHDFVVFSADWFYGMWLRLYFSLGGPEVNFQTRGPLIIPSISAIAFGVAGLIAFILSIKSWRKNKYYLSRIFIITVTLLYVITLFFDEFKSFKYTGAAVAINGRYLLLILLPIIALFVLAVNELFFKYIKTRAALAIIVILCLVWGGGVFTYIIRSNNSWYWNSKIVKNINQDVRNILGPVSPGSNNPIIFL